MGLFNKYKIKAKDIKQYVSNYGGCLATKMITQKGKGVNYMYKDEPDNDVDSGWRFFSGFETDEYVNNPKNIEVYDVNTIVNYSPDIIPFLDIEKGYALERDSKTNRFFRKSTIFTFLTITLKLYLILKFRPIIMCLHLYINMFSTLIYP